MAGQYRFKDINGNVVAQISSSADGTISFSGSAVDFSNASTITLGQVQLAGTASNALLLDGFDSTAFVFTSSFNTISQSISSQLNTLQTTSGSNIGRLNNLESKSSSVDISISSINTVTESVLSRTSNLETKSSSVDISISNINSFTASNNITSLNSKTGSYATTGSNTFFGTQTFSGSVYIANDLIVQGSSSIQYISASSVSIGTNIVQLNTANPSVRFAGLTIIDSGSIGGSGSFLYDSVQDEFIFVHRGNNTNVTSSHFVLGPETYDSLGNETYLTTNRLPKGTGKEHLVDSNITDTGTLITLGSNTTITGTLVASGTTLVSSSAQIVYTSLSSIPSGIVSGSTQVRTLLPAGTISGSSQVVSIANSQLTNSTISGKALGTNLDTLTIGTGLSGTSYNGSSAVTIANSGVTSIVAGTGISINQGTAAVTVTNTITNNNQLTNGAGYITGAGNAATATALSSGQSNWSGTGVLSNVVGLLAWKNYTNGHIIFDASNSTSPSGGSVNNANAQIAWTGTYPTLMGWNGSNTYGVRVDSSRVSDSTTGNAATVTNGVYNNASQNNLSGVFNFGSSGATPYNNPTGTSNGISFGGIESTSLRTYGIFTEQENIGGNYSKLTFNYHTGVRIGASSSYGGTRFYNNFAGGSGGGTEIFSIGNGDNNARSSADIIAYASDKRLKENITNIPNALDKIKQINGVYFDWKDKTKELGFNPSQKHDVGVIAQEIQAILPEVVTLAPFDYELGKSKSGENYLTVKYDKLVPLLIEAIKEQQIKIDNLTIEVENLKKPKGL